VQEAAEAQVEAQHNRAVIVVAGLGWHPGVIGIVAGRIKEKTGKPTLVIALDDGGQAAMRADAGMAPEWEGLGPLDPRRRSGRGDHCRARGRAADQGRRPCHGLRADHRARQGRAAGRLARRTARPRCGQGACGAKPALDLSLSPGGLTPALVEALEGAGPYGVGWPGPRVAVGPVRLVKCDLVGNDHVRAIVAGADGRSFKAMAFRAAQTELGQTLLHGGKGRQFWLAGRARLDDWGSRPAAELHIEDAAFAD
jgi:single-stranded-DNA-specific exonuclease